MELKYKTKYGRVIEINEMLISNPYSDFLVGSNFNINSKVINLIQQPKSWGLNRKFLKIIPNEKLLDKKYNLLVYAWLQSKPIKDKNANGSYLTIGWMCNAKSLLILEKKVNLLFNKIDWVNQAEDYYM